MKSLSTKYLAYFSSVVVPVTFGLAFVLATGPHIQRYLISLLNTDIPSIYGSAYKESIIVFPRLSEWVGAGFTWPFLLMALLITFFAVRPAEPRLVAWRTAAASFVLLCVYDLTSGYFGKQFTIAWLVENSVSNLLGGVLISGFLVTALSLADFLYLHIPGGSVKKRIISGVGALASGLLFCCLIYYLTDFFYNTLPVRLEISFAAPVNGAAAPMPNAQSSDLIKKSMVQPFSFVPANEITGNATWTSGEQGLEVNLLPNNNRQTYQVSVTLLSGCGTPDQVKKLDDDAYWLEANNIDALKVSFDPGLTQFFTLLRDSQTSSFKIGSGKVSMFNIDQDGQSKSLNVTQFLGDDTFLDLESITDEQSFFLSAPLLKTIGKETSLSSRTLTLTIGTQKYLLIFHPPERTLQSKEKVICSVRQEQQKAEPGFTILKPTNLVAGVMIKVRRKEIGAMRVDTLKTALRVTGGAGWLGLVGLQPEQLKNHSLGTLKMFSLRGNVIDYVIDGSPLAIRPPDEYSALGEMQIKYGDQGKLYVEGRANRLWKNQHRMNPTKWEKLGWETKIFLLGLFGTFFTSLWPLLAQRLRVNRRFAWIN